MNEDVRCVVSALVHDAQNRAGGSVQTLELAGKFLVSLAHAQGMSGELMAQQFRAFVRNLDQRRQDD